MFLFVQRLKKGCLGEIEGFHVCSVENKGPGQRRARVPKLPFASLENLCGQREELLVMANTRTMFDPHSNENTLSGGNKLPRSSGGKIKEKISLWEGKEPSLGHCTSTKKTESLTHRNCKTAEEQGGEKFWRVFEKEMEHFGKENGDAMPASPDENGKELKGTLKRSKPCLNQKGHDCIGVINKGKQETDNVDKLVDSRPCSPAETGKQLRRTFKGSKPNGNQKGEECSKIVHMEKQDHKKERS